jgi:phosphoglycerate dehydrogenase-like enzyme
VCAAVAEAALEAVRARAPENVVVVPLDDGPDLNGVDFLVPTIEYPDVLQALPGLHGLAVVQVLSAGVDWIESQIPPQTTLCSARGARDDPVAEWVLGALLGTTSHLLEFARTRRWSRRDPGELGTWTVLIVGMGSIGRHVQRLLAPIGSRVIGVASQARDGLHGVDELPALLPQADAVVVLTPLTEATRGLIGRAELAAMRDGALLVNAARGPVVDTEALVDEVSSGRLRAVLDVTDPEPLPQGHPLWAAPDVLSITPHIAGDSLAGNARAAELAADQLARWCAGEPLHNVVRPGA